MANKPNNPSLWSKAKSLAKQKFDVYPSAYANGWAAKWYKSKGGTWRKAEYGMEVNDMAYGGEPQNAGFQALPNYVQNKIMANMAFGGYIPEMMHGGYYMQDGGEPDGAMAIGQIESSIDKLMNLRKFIQPDSDLEPWISSKLTLMDHYTDAVNDYMQYNPEAQEGEEYEEDEMMMMAEGGGIPQRYKNMGFNKVGVKKKSTRPGKKWMVLAKKGSQYKVVHGGYKGMQDFTQHRNEGRRKNFWNRMGGKSSSKATDPFSPLYWHKRFGTWEEGGQVDDVFANGGYFSGNKMNLLQDGGKTTNINESRQFLEDWHNSPMGRQMLEKSVDQDDPYGINYFHTNNLQNIRNLGVKGANIKQVRGSSLNSGISASEDDNERTMATASKYQTELSDLKTLASVPNNFLNINDDRYTKYALAAAANKKSSDIKFSDELYERDLSPLLVHELSHSSDSGGDMMPNADIDKINNYFNNNIKNSKSRPDIPFTRYVGRPTETRARLNDFRYRAKRQGLYDPFTQKITPKLFNKYNRDLILKKYFNNQDTNLDPIKQLRTTFTDEQIIDMLNSISQNNNQSVSDMAKYGGYIGYDGKRHMSNTPTWSGNVGYQGGGEIDDAILAYEALAQLPNASLFEYGMGGTPCYECGGSYAYGGIHINPANKGKFTASAQRAGMGVQEFAQHVMANREDYSPTQVKRANFARNAAKWKKQEGGPMVGDEMDVTPEQLEYLRQMGYEFEMI